MSESLRLGRIAGIRVGVNASVLVIVVIIAAGLALGEFPSAYPDQPAAAYWAASLVTALLFLASLLAHEVAHAVVATRNGLGVEGITLWLLGGVAQLRGEPRTPGADLRIAAVGPLTSLALGIGYGLLGGLARAVGVHGLPVGVLAYLAGVNVLLAVFNLIPTAPLDGGRVLRAFLWWRRGDRVAAAVAASRAGRLFGFLLIALGTLQVVGGGGLGGLWLGLVGLFLVNAATAEEQQARLSGALSGIRVADLMTPHPATADPNESVAQFLDDVVLHTRYSGYPLVDPFGRLTGLVTLNRLRDVPAEQRRTMRLRDVACPPAEVPQASPDEPLVEVLPRMRGCTDGRVVVLDGEARVVGIVSPSDISRVMQLANLGVLHPYTAPGRGADVHATPGDG